MYDRLMSLQWDLQVIPNWNFKHLVCIAYIQIEFGPVSEIVEHAQCYDRNIYAILVSFNHVSCTLVLVVRVIHTLQNFLFKNKSKCR